MGSEQMSTNTEAMAAIEEAKRYHTIASQEPPPGRFIAGADAIVTPEQKLAPLKEQIDANRELSISLALEQAAPAGSAS
jgi:hypothetical protein